MNWNQEYIISPLRLSFHSNKMSKLSWLTLLYLISWFIWLSPFWFDHPIKILMPFLGMCVLITSVRSILNSLEFQGLWPARFLCPWDCPSKNTGVGCHFLLQGIFQPRDWTWVSCIAGRFFTICATREAKFLFKYTRVLYHTVDIITHTVCFRCEDFLMQNQQLHTLWLRAKECAPLGDRSLAYTDVTFF